MCVVTFYSHVKNTNNVENIINLELDNVHKGFSTINLSVNLTKTNFLLFSNRQSLIIPRIVIINHQVELTYCVRFIVCIHIISYLGRHIDYVSNKLSTLSFLIYKASYALDCKDCIKYYICITLSSVRFLF